MLTFSSVARDHELEEGREVLEMIQIGERVDYENEIQKTVALTCKEKMELSLLNLKMKFFY